MPNEYTSFCDSLKEWRRLQHYDESSSESEDGVPRRSQYAPPTSYQFRSTESDQGTQSQSLKRCSIFSKCGSPPGPPPLPPLSVLRKKSMSPIDNEMQYTKRASELPSCDVPDTASFAERIMAKYGYKKGQGLVCILLHLFLRS